MGKWWVHTVELGAEVVLLRAQLGDSAGRRVVRQLVLGGDRRRELRLGELVVAVDEDAERLQSARAAVLLDNDECWCCQ